MARFAGRSALARDERGQGLVEFALILPVLLLILVGIIEFGSIYSKVISMRQGVREAGRQGSVANFGTVPPTCTLNGVPFGVSDEIQALICMAKDQAGVGDSARFKVRVRQFDALELRRRRGPLPGGECDRDLRDLSAPVPHRSHPALPGR